MRIGIITFHESDNYGAILQTFALQARVKEICNDVEIIDYKCINKSNMYSIFDIGKHRTDMNPKI